jgi:hypothetical protein
VPSEPPDPIHPLAEGQSVINHSFVLFISKCNILKGNRISLFKRQQQQLKTQNQFIRYKKKKRKRKGFFLALPTVAFPGPPGISQVSFQKYSMHTHVKHICVHVSGFCFYSYRK